MTTTKLPRVFRYNSVELEDPGPEHDPVDVRNLYAATYPEIVSAGIDGPEEKDGKHVYTFRKAVGTKGVQAAPRTRVHWERLTLRYTTPAVCFRTLDIDQDLKLKVIGGDGEGAYEWVIERGGAVDKHSDCGYGSPDFALRDGLIEYCGLPSDVESKLAGMTPAATGVMAERRRQIEQEGWDAAHDDGHDAGELAAAGAAYALNASCVLYPLNGTPLEHAPEFWMWDMKWWKPKTPRRDLVRAGALILAEIEKLDRAASKEPHAA